jgi:hypothetical protein
LKSMPMVEMKDGVNESSLKRSRQQDLPTPESPIRSSLICVGASVLRPREATAVWYANKEIVVSCSRHVETAWSPRLCYRRFGAGGQRAQLALGDKAYGAAMAASAANGCRERMQTSRQVWRCFGGHRAAQAAQCRRLGSDSCVRAGVDVVAATAKQPSAVIWCRHCHCHCHCHTWWRLPIQYY